MTEPVNLISVDRYWFLTWTTYGTWLPGDDRGFVGLAPDELGRLVNHNQFGTPPAAPNSRLCESIQRNLKSSPVFLTFPQAVALLEQFQETVRFRNWLLIAVGTMRTHLHVIVAVPGDPDPEKILGDLKAYASRRLNRNANHRRESSWWTEGGSKRKLAGESNVEAVVHYIQHQPNPLLIWTREEGVIFQSSDE